MHPQKRRENIASGYRCCWVFEDDTEILMGDLNDKVRFEHQQRSAVGTCRWHDESYNGLPSAPNIVIGNITFPHKTLHLATWTSPHGRIKTMKLITLKK
jgi:hypothetical protein